MKIFDTEVTEEHWVGQYARSMSREEMLKNDDNRAGNSL